MFLNISVILFIVLATPYEHMPQATPIEYHSKGIKLYFAGEPGTKIKNTTNNQNVSIGIYLPYAGGIALKEHRSLEKQH